MSEKVITVSRTDPPEGQFIKFRYAPPATTPKQVFVEPEDLVRGMLLAIGEDPNRPGLKETPARVVKAWQELFAGYAQKPDDILKVFTDCGQADEMVVMKDIPFTSMCEHHMLPFSGVAHVGYLPMAGRVVGLSKLARLVEIYARRLQVQERMTEQIADALHYHGCKMDGERWVQRDPDGLRPRGVGVVIAAEHGCMSCRGVRKPGTTTITSALRGAFKDDPATRAEFLALTRS